MALATGARLGPYEIVSALGAGGMGEVYRARDTRLERVVAIKILSEELAANPEFRDRLQREARAVSQLSHPHICTLHDVGEHANTFYLVMELLDGETLAERLERSGSPNRHLPLSDALQIALQIADGLSAAHRKGIIHRDLKPANVMLVQATGARSGMPYVKLLDFGLATMAVHDPTIRGPLAAAITSPHQLTSHGTILGTFQYMAPEQLEGADADTRTDIFAFGCVLYEMLAGQKAFDGKTQASLVAAILAHEPPSLSASQPLTPPLVDSIVRKCLAKKPDDRWQSVSDLGTALQWASEAGSTSGANAAAVTIKPPLSATRRALRRAFVAALALALLAAGVGLGRRSFIVDPASPLVFDVLPPDGVNLSPSPVASTAQVALAPDGKNLAFVASARHGVSQLWVRPLDSREAVPLAGTEGASFPFWSPDSRSLAFYAGGTLKRVDLAGGAPQPLCPAAGSRGGAWGANGVLLVALANGPMTTCASTGGVLRVVTALPQGAIGHTWPQFLPDGRRFLYYQRAFKPENQGVYVASLDSSNATQVLASGGMAVYDSGHLLFVRDGLLLAQPFDEHTLKTSGEPRQVADHVGYFPANLGYASVTASGSGAIAYGPAVPVTTTLQWRNRAGAVLGSPAPPGVYRSPRLSPDEKSALLVVTDSALGAQPDLWTLDLGRGVRSRLTTDPSVDWFPVWWPSGNEVAFGSAREGYTAAFRKAGMGEERPVVDPAITGGMAVYPSDLSADGKFLLYMQSTHNGYDLGTLSFEGSAALTAFLSSRFNEVQGRFSPNGRWIAYGSDETDRFEVYVRPFPVTMGHSKISVAGGTQPEWRRDGRELFYIAADGKMMAVPVTTGPSGFEAGTPHPLFDVEVPEPNSPFPTDYAVTADGQRFLVNTLVDQPTRPALTVILHWTER